MDFGEVIEGYLAGRIVPMTPLLGFMFATPAYLWNGPYSLESGGKTFIGSNRLIGIEGLEQAATLESSDMTFTLSGADAQMGALFPLAAQEDRSAYVGSIVIVYLQFMDTKFAKPIAEPWAFKAGICGTMEMTKQFVEGEGYVRTISLPAKNIFFGRGVSPNSNWSDRDQQMRHTGDIFLDRITELQDYTLTQPWR